MRNPDQEQRARNRSFRNGLPAAHQSVTLGGIAGKMETGTRDDRERFRQREDTLRHSL